MKREVSDESLDQQRDSVDDSSSTSGVTKPQGHPASLSTSALLFDAIKARRKQSVKRADSSDCGSGGSTAINAVKTSKPMDLMAAIRARKRAQSNASAEDSVASTTIVNSPNASTGDAAKSA